MSDDEWRTTLSKQFQNAIMLSHANIRAGLIAGGGETEEIGYMTLHGKLMRNDEEMTVTFVTPATGMAALVVEMIDACVSLPQFLETVTKVAVARIERGTR